jgi:hypothetical protein
LCLLAGQFVHNVNQSIASANGRRSRKGTLNYIWIVQTCGRLRADQSLHFSAT